MGVRGAGVHLYVGVTGRWFLQTQFFTPQVCVLCVPCVCEVRVCVCVYGMSCVCALHVVCVLMCVCVYACVFCHVCIMSCVCMFCRT